MKTIWKYEVREYQWHQISMPVGAKVISVHIQNDKVCIWAEVDTEAKGKEGIWIEIIGTGDEVPDVSDSACVKAKWHEREFIGTVLNSAFVWHVYQRRPRDDYNEGEGVE